MALCCGVKLKSKCIKFKSARMKKERSGTVDEGMGSAALLLQRIEQLEQEKVEFKSRQESLKRINQLLVDALTKKERERWELRRGEGRGLSSQSPDMTPIDRLATDATEKMNEGREQMYLSMSYPQTAADHDQAVQYNQKTHNRQLGRICYNWPSSKQLTNPPMNKAAENSLASKEVPTSHSLNSQQIRQFLHANRKSFERDPTKQRATVQTANPHLNKQNECLNQHRRSATNKQASPSINRLTKQSNSNKTIKRAHLDISKSTHVQKQKKPTDTTTLLKKSVRFLK